ncbi:hypothetical protein QMK33_22670 [Hymenobacter sp. H14-R3]|uniref:hypothetical protein n=1 Tax=Hymenobacter sp. H14-R3 TaxID=3046308 RepID=UPI0024BBD615|nr:hypothetical protein [Hymenobacter sp. H14-R3]MDJ0367955.1 hypothetical protein [Hymenobacter sp. H14-R3]
MPPAPNTSEHKFCQPPSSGVGSWLFFSVFSGILVFNWWPGAHSVGGHLFFALGEAVLVWLLVKFLRDKSVTCLTIGPRGITKEQGGTTETLRYLDIKGFSEKHAKNYVYTLIEALPTAGKNKDIEVEPEFPEYQAIRAMLALHIPDLDKAEEARDRLARAQATAKLLEDSRLGPTPSARSAALSQGQKFTLWLNIAAILAGGWVAFYPHPAELARTLAVAVPLVAVGALWVGRGLLQFIPNSEDPHPNMLTAIAAPTLPLLFHLITTYNFFSWRPVWPVAGWLGLAFGVLLLLGGRRGVAQSTRLGLVLPVALVLAAAYGLAAAIAYNIAGGGQYITRYVVPIAYKGVSSGDKHHYYVATTLWPATQTEHKFLVSPRYYAQKQRGDTMQLRLHHGRLGADWDSVTSPE